MPHQYDYNTTSSGNNDETEEWEMAGRINEGLDRPGELEYKDARVVYHENELYELNYSASGQPKHDRIPTQYAPSHLISTPCHPQTPESAPKEHVHNAGIQTPLLHCL